MKTFEFSLEKILQLRFFYEDKAKIELGRAISESERLKTILQSIAIEKVKTRKKMGLDNFVLYSFLSSEMYLKNLDIKKEQMLKKLAEAELKVEKARAVFLEATKKRKVLSRLKEKQEEVWKKEARQESDSMIDDIVNSKISQMTATRT